ncbi:MAG: phosphoribosyltransferase [archaeon]
MEPKKALEGLQELLNLHPIENIYQVIIESPTRGKLPPVMRYIKGVCSLKLPEERTLYYIPPGNIGNAKKPRQEKIPKVTAPDKPHLIIDDTMETGKTLEAAMSMLEKQGVNSEQMWFFTSCIMDSPIDDQIPRLDKAKIIIAYRRAHPSIRDKYIV